MGMFEEIKKRDEYEEGVNRGEITFKFEETNDGIGISCHINCNSRMMIEAIIELTEAIAKKDIPHEVLEIAILNRKLMKMRSKEND